ncbi:uncharacterized protein LOC119078368 [Bradysia coprophila]|uniref:uncharacterized protein LOC119078368 n=1 Tax=Bradysia coprophila TaxID=38358 RepID=UPI00187DC55F|nr:uncharacterized protein LOC119078368 [Bradysia coprophila]
MLINNYISIVSISILYFTGISFCRQICREEDPCENGKSNEGDKLIMTHTVCRHGDRNIYTWIAPSVENDPWSPEKQICREEDPCENGKSNEGDKLIMTHTVCRHGDRNIYTWIAPSVENDPWSPEKYWPGGYAQLTNIGKRQHYKLGQYFKKRYASLVGIGLYKANLTSIRSTVIYLN